MKFVIGILIIGIIPTIWILYEVAWQRGFEKGSEFRKHPPVRYRIMKLK